MKGRRVANFVMRYSFVFLEGILKVLANVNIQQMIKAPIICTFLPRKEKLN